MRNFVSNFLQAAALGEAAELYDTLSQQQSEAASIIVKDDGGISFPVTAALSRSQRVSMPTTFTEFELSMVTDLAEVQQFETSRELFLHFCQQLLGQPLTIYGMMLVVDGWRINPLHPLVTAGILSGEITLPESFTVFVYPSRIPATEVQPTLVETYAAQLTDLIKLTAGRATYKYTVKPRLSKEDWLKLVQVGTLLDQRILIESGGAQPPYAITPVQFGSYSTIFPWYGIVGSKLHDREYKSINLAPMLSGNISARAGDWNSTCTGNLSNHFVESLAVLQILNFNSAYNSEVIPGSKKELASWIYTCQQVAIAQLATLLPKVEPTAEQAAQPKPKRSRKKKNEEAKGEQNDDL